MPIVSIIIPVYNAEKYLERCIESVINQSLKDIEIILINDGSIDRSKEICDYYAIKDRRIKVIHKCNEGVSKARNIGLNLATGKWIGFVDSDDYIYENMYEILYKNASKFNSDISACFFSYLTKENKLLFNPTDEDKKLCGIYKKNKFLNLLYLNPYSNGICVSMCNKIYNRKIFKEMRFANGIYEDDRICHEIYTKEYITSLIDLPLYTYVENPDSITNKKLSEKNIVFLDILNERFNLFKKYNLTDLESNTLKLYLNKFIEFYELIKKEKDDKEYQFYKLQYKNILSCSVNYNLTIKDRIRFNIFYISPKVYKFLIKFIQLIK